MVPCGHDVGGAGADVALERIGLVRIDVDQRPAQDLAVNGAPFSVPWPVRLKSAAAEAGDLFVGGDPAGEAAAPPRVLERHDAVGDGEVADRRQLAAAAALAGAAPKVQLSRPLASRTKVKLGRSASTTLSTNSAAKQRLQVDREREAGQRRHLAGPQPTPAARR